MELHAAGPEGRAGAGPWLIAAVTGRALAASARRGGHRVVVLDYFADRDCAEHAMGCRAVVSPGGFRFDAKTLLAAAATLAPARLSPGLIYGSGFESRLSLLGRLAAGRSLYGNAPNLVGLVKDPERFSDLLRRLAIPQPETRLSRPARSQGWLAKKRGGAGGVHVRPASQVKPGSAVYYQRMQPGRSLSVLFLANRKRAALLGFNQQWTSVARSDLPYQFGGAVGGISLPRRVVAQLTAAVDRLVEATGLRGLNGLDFLLDGSRWAVLEVNPRPTATVELYDPDYPRGLFDWHLRACEGLLPDRVPSPRACRALSIVAAPEPWESGDEVGFPGWCRDLPRSGLHFGPGDPVCTVHASASDPRSAVRLVQNRQARIESMLSRRMAMALR